MPDPLPTLEPVASLTGPALKNEMMLPAVLDPWAGTRFGEAVDELTRDRSAMSLEAANREQQK